MNVTFNGNYYFTKNNGQFITKAEQQRAFDILDNIYGKNKYITYSYVSEENENDIEGIHLVTCDHFKSYLQKLQGVPLNYYSIVERQSLMEKDIKYIDFNAII